MVRACSQCQRPNPNDARFCEQCGAGMNACSGCGKPLNQNANFCSFCGQPTTQSVSVSAQSPNPAVDAHNKAERRQLTVLFCDVVGSTQMSERLDPEEYREVLTTYQHRCETIVNDFGGWIAQYLGDGLLIYFGYPVAHEDDTVRAIDAALQILSALPEMNATLASTQSVQLRIGVHTGAVVVGEISPGDRRTELAFGDTVNLTFRLLDHAEPGELVISESARRLSDGLFQVHNIGPKSLKGISAKTLLHKVLAATDARSRLDLAAMSGYGVLAGFQAEIGLLNRSWRRSTQEYGQGFAVSGDAGTGKSRLLLAFKESIQEESHTWVECRCTAYGQGSAFSAVIAAVLQLLGISKDDSASEKFSKLELGIVASGLDPAVAIPPIASMLSLPVSESYSQLAGTPESARQELLECLVNWLETESKKQPVVLVMEDLHWVDPSTLELLELMLERIHSIRCFILMTHRPNFEPTWRRRSYISQINMPRLSDEEAEVIISNAVKGKTLPRKLVDEVIARTDGVPLFLEELTLALIESELVEEREDHYVLLGSISDLQAPETLQGSLMARLDQMGSAKSTAQLAAVLGRECGHDLLEAVSPLGQQELSEATKKLDDADLLYRTGVAPRASYRFKHALTQDVAYRSLLHRTRQNHHARVASVLEAQFPHLVDSEPELVARHYEEALQLEQALLYWENAANRAFERSAYREAIAHADHAIALINLLPDSEDFGREHRGTRELALQLMLGGAYIAIRGHGHMDVQQSYERARMLCQEVPDAQLVSQALVGLSAYYVTIHELETSHTLANELLAVAQRSDDSDVSVAANLTMGITLWWMGRPTDSMLELEQTIALHNPAKQRLRTYVAGQDPGIIARAFSAWSHWLAGYPDQAMTRVEEGIALAAQRKDYFNLAFALGCANVLYCLRRDDLVALEQRATETISLCEEHGFPIFLTLGRLSLGWVRVHNGDASGLAEIEAGVAMVATSGPIITPIATALYADALCHLGHHAAAVSTVRSALAEQNRGEPWDAELLRLEGQGLYGAGKSTEEALACYQKSLDVAQRQGARGFELRTALSIAELVKESRSNQQPTVDLGAVYALFDEGLNTHDLRAVRHFLES